MKKLIFIIVTALTLCTLCGCAFVGNSAIWSDVDYDNEGAYTIGGGEISATVTQIEINWIEESIEVKYGDSDKLIISESVTSENSIPEKLKLRYIVEGQKLTIQFATNGRHDIRDLHKSLTVLIPQNTQLDRLSVDTVSGDVAAEVDVKALDVDIVSGNVTAYKVNQSANVDTVSGNVKLYTSDVTYVDVESVSGNVYLYVPESLGFTLSLDTVSGDFNSSLPTTQRGDTYTRLEGGADFNVDTVSGNVEIALNA